MRFALVPALVTALALPATAAEVVKGDRFSFELSGFYKPYVSWLLMQPALVSGLTSLQHLLEDAQLPATTGFSVPSAAGLSTHTVRLGAKVSYTDALEFETAYQVTGLIASHAAFAGTGSSTYLGANLITAQRRLYDFDPYLVDQGTFKVQHNLDRLALTWRAEHFTLVVGRQVISWGAGKLWNPTDVLSPFAPTDVDREVRRGVDAARLSIGLGDTSQLDVLFLPQRQAIDLGGVVRARTNLLGWDFSATFGKYAQDVVIGADVSGDVSVIGVHAEAAYTLPLVGLDGSSPLAVKGDFVRAVVGAEWRPLEKLVLVGEYSFNGFGARNASDLLTVLRSARVIRGEVFGAGRHYAGLVASVLATELLSFNATLIANLTDPSAMLVPSLEYSFEQHVLIRAGAYVPLGRGPDSAVFSGLTTSDVTSQSAAWQHAVSTLGARSEYGLSPFGFFVQVGLYVN